MFISYLKIDTQIAPPPGSVLWMPAIEDATPFGTVEDAEVIRNQFDDAVGVMRSENGYFYVYTVQGNLT
jgi:hypothetical protein